jgi:hypothetical protein
VKLSRERLGSDSKLEYVNRRRVSDIARFTCALSLDLLSQLMRRSWTYGFAIDASTDSFGTPLLDIRIGVCLPSAELLPADIVAMPMFESHTSLHMLDVVKQSDGQVGNLLEVEGYRCHQ